MRKMWMEFPDFNAKMLIALEEENKELCDEVWNALPFSAVQEHGMVSGDLIYCWVPIVSLAKTRKSYLHTESPIGCVSYSQRTGNKSLIKYGECSEDLSAPVLGQIAEKDLEKLAFISREVWFNYFNDKKVLAVHFSKAEEDA